MSYDLNAIEKYCRENKETLRGEASEIFSTEDGKITQHWLEVFFPDEINRAYKVVISANESYFIKNENDEYPLNLFEMKKITNFMKQLENFWSDEA